MTIRSSHADSVLAGYCNGCATLRNGLQLEEKPMKTDWPAIVVAGPTAAGKSRLALDLAQEFDGEIIGCDSVQIYRYFDLGTAKTPFSERRGIPHHLISVADPRDRFTAGDYLRLGRQALDQVRHRGKIPIVVGGTGLYLRALIDGLFHEAEPAHHPDRDRWAVRDEHQPGLLWRYLRRLDPGAAAKIHPHDRQKLIRALTVALRTGTPLTVHQAQERNRLSGFSWSYYFLDPPRAELRSRIRQRSQQMFAQGLIDEAAAILALGVPRTAKPFASIGYAQALQVIDKTMTYEQAVAETALRTGQYAKRQSTWFRHHPGMNLLPGFGDNPLIRQHLCPPIR